MAYRTEDSPYFSATGFLYRIQNSLLKINIYRTNFDPEAWWKEMRVVEAEAMPKLKINENNTDDEEFDRNWYDDYEAISENVKVVLGGYQEALHNPNEEFKELEIAEAKRKTFEPLDQMHKHLLKIVWKKGWQMPEGMEEGYEASE